MNSRTVERVRSWGAVSVSDGFRGLHDLADDEFSGAVVADETWLFMLNGRVVGVHEGDIGEFEGESLSAYEAPHLSLPLLFSMQEQGGETQATYYTNDTPLAETDETLSDAGFTGYVELSENVLSGDYYSVYYGGRSMSAAFVGASEELVSGEEAFERANDEVGLYEVVTVDLDVTDVPEPAGERAVTAGSEAESASEPEPERDTGTDEESDEESEAESTASAAEPEPSESPIEDAEAESASGAESAEPSESPGDSSPPESERASASTRPSPERPENEHVEESPSARAVENTDGVFSEEEAWRETTTVPSLDPEKSTGVKASAQTGQKQRQASKPQSTTQTQRPKQSGGTPEQVAALKEAVEEREERIEELEARAREAEAEAEDLRAELDDLRAERDSLRSEVESLREDLEAARERGAVTSGPNDLPPAEALAGTNLFVRYESKADPTLDAVGEAGREAVNANLRLEHHTQFDASETTVNDDPFDRFLEGSAAYRFVSWIVRDLPYELIDTEHTKDLGDVFHSIPAVDRAELDGTVSVRDDEGEETRMTFDVVLRDRMGNPLLVAELNAERDPVTADEMEKLVEDAETISDVQDSLGGAFYVTASFFEPGALEAAEDATGGGGFLSRSDKESYVKTARKSGFHLCLVEDRNETFHVTVPEL